MSEHTLKWEDGDLPVSTLFDDTFYSRHDGRAETAYVFLDGNGLPERWTGVEAFHIGELGFGTGLNFLETWRSWISNRTAGQTLHFTSFERYPLTSKAMERALASWPDLADLTGRLVSCWPDLLAGDSPHQLDAQTHLQMVRGEALPSVANWKSKADAWFLDGFSPAKNPDMWSAELMQHAASHTAPAGTFATYTSAGWVRRNLEEAGFTVTKRPGHGTKREMMLGILTDK